MRVPVIGQHAHEDDGHGHPTRSSRPPGRRRPVWMKMSCRETSFPVPVPILPVEPLRVGNSSHPFFVRDPRPLRDLW
jgi:hypothetical protein